MICSTRPPCHPPAVMVAAAAAAAAADAAVVDAVADAEDAAEKARPGGARLIPESDWRREQDSNLRNFRSTVFKTAALNRSAIPPLVGFYDNSTGRGLLRENSETGER